jgi:hypothetical protein
MLKIASHLIELFARQCFAYRRDKITAAAMMLPRDPGNCADNPHGPDRQIVYESDQATAESK